MLMLSYTWLRSSKLRCLREPQRSSGQSPDLIITFCSNGKHRDEAIILCLNHTKRRLAIEDWTRPQISIARLRLHDDTIPAVSSIRLNNYLHAQPITGLCNTPDIAHTSRGCPRLP